MCFGKGNGLKGLWCDMRNIKGWGRKGRKEKEERRKGGELIER